MNFLYQNSHQIKILRFKTSNLKIKKKQIFFFQLAMNLTFIKTINQNYRKLIFFINDFQTGNK